MSGSDGAEEFPMLQASMRCCASAAPEMAHLRPEPVAGDERSGSGRAGRIGAAVLAAGCLGVLLTVCFISPFGTKASPTEASEAWAVPDAIGGIGDILDMKDNFVKCLENRNDPRKLFRDASAVLADGGKACLGMAAGAEFATAGAATPVLLGCGALAVGGTIGEAVGEKLVDDNTVSTSKQPEDGERTNIQLRQDLVAAIDRGYEKLGHALKVDMKDLKQQIKEGTQQLRSSLEEFHQQYTNDQLNVWNTKMDAVSSWYTEYVLEQGIGESDFPLAKLIEFESHFNPSNFEHFVETNLAASQSWFDIVSKRIPSFLAARTQLFALHRVWCRLPSSFMPGSCRCPAPKEARLTVDLTMDLESFRDAMKTKAAGQKVHVKDLPPGLTHLSFPPDVWGYVGFAGNYSDLPYSLTHLVLPTSARGRLADLPRGLRHLRISANAQVQGGIADLPRSLTHLEASGLAGRLADLPRSLTHLVMECSLTGQLEDLPPRVQHLELSYTAVGGSLASLPTSLSHLSLSLNKDITGELSDLPAELRHLGLFDQPKLGGSLSDLPLSLTHLFLSRVPQVGGHFRSLQRHVRLQHLHLGDRMRGAAADLPRALTYLKTNGDCSSQEAPRDFSQLPPQLQYLETGDRLALDVGDLPRTLQHLRLLCGSPQDISGGVAELPDSLQELFLLADNAITGRLGDFPRTLEKVGLGSNGLTGDVAELPSSLRSLELPDNTKITGDVSALPLALRFLDLHRNTKIGGELKAIPRQLIHLDLHENDEIRGNVRDLPPSFYRIDLSKNSRITGKPVDAPSGNFGKCMDCGLLTPLA